MPGAPQSFAAARGDRQATLTWSAAASNGVAITRYEYQKDSDSWQNAGGSSARSRTINGLTNGVEYTFKLRAVNAVGDGAVASTTVTPATTPGAPQSFTATRGHRQATLTWTAAASNGASITKYQYQQGSGSWTDISGGGSATSHTVTGLTNGTAYTFKLRAVNAVGNGAETSAATVTPAAVPGAPQSFTAAAGSAQATLTWTAAASNGAAISKYQYQQGSGSWTDITGGGSATSHTVTGLTNGTAYTFKLRAVNAAGNGAEASATVTPATTPGAPQSFAAAPGNTQASLSWTAPASNGGGAISKYQYQQGSGSWTDISGGGAATSHTVTGLTNGTAYAFKLRAVNSAGNGAEASTTVTPAAVPGAPGSFTATAGNTQATLSWTASASNGAAISKYQYQQGSGSWTDITGGGSATSHTVTGLTNGTAYTFKLRAVNSAGNGAEASATVTPAAVPGAPQSFAAARGDGQASLSWTAPASNGGSSISKYQYQQGSGSWTDITGGGSATSHTVTGLTNGTAYTFKLRAVNSAGNGAEASTTVTPAAVPGAPQSFAAARGDRQATLTWSAAASNGVAITRYEYQKDSDSWQNAGGGSARSRTINGLTNGVEYTFKLRAVNAVGDGAVASTTVTPATTPGAPQSFTATRGHRQATLTWTAAASNGASITKYQYQQGSGSWTDVSGGGSATSHTVTGLTNGATYTFKLRAVNAVGNGAETSAATVTPAAVPGAPGSFTATSGSAQATLSWTAAASNGAAISKYQYQQGSGSWTDITGGGSATSHTVTGLTNGTAYTFKLRAVNSAGNGAEASATVTPATTPGAPQSFAAAPSDGQASLSWTAPASNGGAAISKYQYQQGSGSWTDISGGGSATSHTVTGLTNGTQYTFKLRAVNSAGNGAEASTTVTPAAVPGAPQSFTATSGNTQATLSWTAAASNGAAISKYQYQQGSGSWTDITGGGSATSHTVTGLTNGTAYTFKLRAVNAAGNGAEASTTVTPATVPGAPQSFAAARGDGQATLTWTAPASNGGASITKYQYQQGSGSWTDITGGGSATSHTVTGLTNGTAYTFKLRAVNSAGNGAEASATVTPAAVPGAPQSFAAARGDGQASLSWTAPASAGGASITKYQYQQGSGSWTDITGGGSATSHTVTGLTNGTAYTFKLRAVNAVGDGAEATTTVTPRGVPGAPGSFAASAGDERTGLSWTAAASNGATISKYQYQQDSGSWTDITGGGSITSVTITGLTNGTQYTFKLRAVNAVGDGAEASTTVTPRGAPGAPGSFTAASGDERADLSWTAAPSNGASITKYQYKQGAGSWTDISGGGSITTHTVRNLTNGTAYTFRLRAVNSAGNGAEASDTVTPSTTPGAPQSFTATRGDEEAALSWTAPASNGGAAISKYQYQQGSGAWTDITGGGSATSVTVTGLTNGTAYTFKLRAINVAGFGPSASATVTPAAVPGLPGSFTATRGDTQATLSWTAAASNGATISKYQFKQDAGAWTDVSGGSSATSHTVTGLTNGTEYTFKVRAVNNVGNGAEATATVTPATTPGAPQSFTAARGDRQATLSWTAAANNGSAITKYQFQQDSGSWTDISGGGSATSHTVSSLTNGTEYTFKLRAVNAVGSGAEASTTVTPATTPGAPRSFTATAGAGQAALSWTAPSSNGGASITKYQYQQDSGSWTDISGGGSATSATVTGLTNGTLYTFKLRAVNIAGNGAATSDTVTPVAAPDAPRSFTAARGDRQAELSWTAPADNGSAITKYQYQQGSGSWQDISDALATSHTVTGLTNGTAYTFKLRAVNAIGNGAEASATVTPSTTPGAPQSFTATRGNTQATLSWTAPSSNGGASISKYQYQQDSGSWTDISGGGSAASHTVTGLTNGTQYTFKLRAVNVAGNGAVASDTVTPAAVPGAPGSFTATRGDQEATLSWTAAAGNGSAITNYQFKQDSGSWTDIAGGASTTSHTVEDLTNGTEYTFKLRAVNAVGYGTEATDTVTPATEPGPPRSFTATRGDGQATLTWTAAKNNGASITKYQFKQDAGAWTDITGGGSATSHTVTGLTNGTSYTFKVRAVNAVGNGAEESATVTPAAVPGAPQSFTAARGNTQATLSWTAPSSNGGAAISKYQYQQGSGSWTDVSGGATATTVTVTSLTNGTLYTFRLRAVNAAGNGAVATATVTPAAIPGAPQSFTAAPGNLKADLSWTAAPDNGLSITKYQYQQDSGSWKDVPDGGSARSLTIHNLTNGTSYTFKLRAVNSDGNGAEATATVTPAQPAQGSVPAQPNNLSATPGDGQATISWTAGSDRGSPITKYRYSLDGADWHDIPGGGSVTSYVVTGLTNGVAQNIYVHAVNAWGTGGYRVISVTPTAGGS